MLRLLGVISLSFFGIAPSFAAESLPVQSAHDTATLVSNVDAVSPNTTLKVGLRLRLHPGWHTYWKNPGDAGEAPDIRLDIPGVPQSNIGPIEWMTPTRIKEQGLMAYAYTGDVLFPQTIHWSGKKDLVIKAHANWLVCAATCVPEKGSFELKLPQRKMKNKESLQNVLFTRAEQTRPKMSPLTAEIAPSGNLLVHFKQNSAPTIADAWFIPDESGRIDQGRDQPVRVADHRVELGLKWLEDGQREAPLSGLLVTANAQGQQTPYTLTAAPRKIVPKAEASFRLGNYLRLAIAAFFGGALLNLMPCVFPVIAMKALSLARMSALPRSHQVKGALCYALGVISMFLLLGGGLIILRKLGSLAGWGFQFQSTTFVVVVGWLLFMLALNLFGVFEFNLGGFGSRVPRREGLLSDVFAGFLAVIVASPCTAPFMGVAIAAALSGPVLGGLALFSSLGLGLATPYVAVASFPSIARHLPKPGPWMLIFKQVLAFPLLASSVWLFWVATLQNGAGVIVVAGGGAVALGFSGWIFGIGQRVGMQTTRRMPVMVCYGAALLAIMLALGGLVRFTQSRAPQLEKAQDQGVQEAYSASKLAALRKEGRPVFVDMTAAWCITCMVNERVAIDTSRVRAAFARNKIVYMKGDWTRRNTEISAFLHAFGRDGVPLYVYYPAYEEGVVLPQILSPQTILNAITAPGKA